MARPVLLLTIGAPPLPVVTPIIAVTVTDTVDPHLAPELAGPEGLSVIAMLDGAHMAWTYAGPPEATFVVQLAEDVAGSPSGWAIAGSTPDLQFTLGGLTSGAVWVRVYATLNGRDSSPTVAVLVTPIPGYQVQANTSAVASLQDDVATINGTLVAHATDLVNLDARADTLENDVGGLQTQTAALAAADSALDARVTAAEGSITAQASQLTSLSSSLEINRSIAGRTPLVFRQSTMPTISGTRYNLLLQTTGLASSPWARTATVTASTVGDPEGYLQAQRITPTGDGKYVRQDVSGLGSIAGRTFSYSVWIRADTLHTASIRFIAGTSGAATVLDVLASNVWQRVKLEVPFTTTETSLRVEIYPKQYGSTGAPNHHIDVFGPQLNEGPVRPYQRVSVANDYDGNGIPPLSTWYNTGDGNKEYGWQSNGSAMVWTLGADTRIAATAAATSALDTRVTAAEGNISTQASQITSINVALPGKASVSAVEALDVRIGATEAGVATYFASYTLTLDVNGYVSGFKSINDGSSSAFIVRADKFQVVPSSGSGGLTLTGTQLDRKFGSAAVYEGDPFGADDLVLWIGPNTVARTAATKANGTFWISSSGATGGGSMIAADKPVYFNSASSSTQPVISATTSSMARDAAYTREITATMTVEGVSGVKFANNGSGTETISAGFVIEVSRDGGAWQQLTSGSVSISVQRQWTGSETEYESTPSVSQAQISAFDSGTGTNLQYRVRETSTLAQPTGWGSALPHSVSVRANQIKLVT